MEYVDTFLQAFNFSECFSAILPDSAEYFNSFKSYLDNVQSGNSILGDAEFLELHSSSILELQNFDRSSG